MLEKQNWDIEMLIDLNADPSTRSIWGIRSKMLLHAQKRRAEATRTLLEPRNSDTVLDIGCGEGYQISYFAHDVSRIIGIDVSRTRLREAKKHVPKAEFVRASSSELPFGPEVFDKVLCLELLEHLHNPSQTTSAIDFVLKDKGILLVSVPYKEQIIHTKCIHCGKPTPHWGHIHSFDARKIRRSLSNDLRILDVKLIGTAAASYPIFAFLPYGIWKRIDVVVRIFPQMTPSWMITKIQKISLRPSPVHPADS